MVISALNLPNSAPDVEFQAAPEDGVLPHGFFATSNLPTYIRHAGSWEMPTRPRMDGALRLSGGGIEVIEGRRVKKGDAIAVGDEEDGSQGIYVDHAAFSNPESSEFRFMSSDVSRERPVDYEAIAAALLHERDSGGNLVWVAGPALVHSRARKDMVWFIEQGFVNSFLAGNAVAVHDMEAAIFGTTLGMTDKGAPVKFGHTMHVRAINRIRACGSIENAVSTGLVSNGIMHALVTRKIPYVLAGSIRDDGPLPGVISDSLLAQDAMREYTTKATGAVFIATALHAIAVGNMLPSFHMRDGKPQPLLAVCVDQTEFVVSKLKDRGTQQAYGVVTNAQDFLHVLRFYIEKG